MTLDNNLLARQKLAAALFPQIEESPQIIEARYPWRQLKPGAMVTRIAPSPTGFMHLGGLYTALISERLAHQSGGIFFLRIEDTDSKRAVPGALELIINSLSHFGLALDEGEKELGRESGDYGPYKQSQRASIYQAWVKQLIVAGQAYPAFETVEELEELTQKQEASKVAPGYYGPWAYWRDKTPAEALAMLDQGLKPVIRWRSNGDPERRLIVSDMFKGRLALRESDQDIVLLKSNGLPTYHLAHVIDDHLMGTTHVIRGDEWLSSLPLHLQLFATLGWQPPIYGHLAPIQKLVGQSRRKLSKRHDPEASVTFYDEAGYPPEAVIAYLLNLANPSFEAWFMSHPDNTWRDYLLVIDELKKGAGALLDFQKLDSYSKEIISRLSLTELVEQSLAWAKKYDPPLAQAMSRDLTYTTEILNIDREGERRRKDIAKWSELRPMIGYFYDDIWDATPLDLAGQLGDYPSSEIQAIAKAVVAQYDSQDSQAEWLAKLRKLSQSLGYAPDTASYRQDPQRYRGSFSDIAKIIRVLLVGRNQSPDLYEVMRVMGRERVEKRLAHYPDSR
ncbi:MAG TPA: glutamate--tRNA ligase family protein [bacterium]|jgi:glutamyl-tRNA synthetase|nr:glutamate--tRNA ligase family protein [bacterium]HOR69598.1 glutamate--tRNA ligase family protein [bacterium]